MAQYAWDIGFDFNALSDPENNNLPYLPNGCIQVINDPVKGWTAGSTPKIFQVGDMLCFNGFDRTENASPGDHTIIGGSITFVKADSATTSSSPFSINPINIGNVVSTSTGTSAYIWTPPNAPGYFNVVGFMTLANPGHYNFTILLDVQDKNQNKMTFRADPEMIVGTGGIG